MKKILSLIMFAAAGIALLSAQTSNPLELFPNIPGSKLVHKCYDANNYLLASLTMEIEDAYLYHTGEGNININYNIMDAQSNHIDGGKMQASYDTKVFSLELAHGDTFDQGVRLLSLETVLAGSFLDIPEVFISYPGQEERFNMQGGDIEISSMSEGNKISILINNRNFDQMEEVTTPAGKFSAAKITYTVKVENDTDRTAEYYNGVEWYTAGAGIVRSEIYKDGQMINYTVMTELDIK